MVEFEILAMSINGAQAAPASGECFEAINLCAGGPGTRPGCGASRATIAPVARHGHVAAQAPGNIVRPNRPPVASTKDGKILYTAERAAE